MPDVVTFHPTLNPPLIREISTGGDNAISWQEIYSEWKDWVLADPQRQGYPAAFTVVGGEPKGGGASLGVAHFMLAPWRFQPAEHDHRLTITGDINYVPAGEPVVVPTIGAFTVLVETEKSTILERIDDADSTTTAAAVWSNADGVRVRYGGAVHIDVAGGAAGTAAPLGTEEFPSSNIADALTIANALGIRKFHIRGTITLTQALDDWQVFGDGEEAEVNINGQDVADSEFTDVRLTGTIGTGPIRARDCEVNGLGGIAGTFIDCAVLAGAHTITGNTRFVRPTSAVAGPGQPIFDFDGAAVSLELRDQIGGAQVANMTHASSTLSIDSPSGHIVVAASCTNGNGVIRGKGVLDRLDVSRVGGFINDDGFTSVIGGAG